MVKIKPLASRILIKRLDAKKSIGGIYLPESAQEKPKQGKVVALGTDNEMGFKEGDEVYFSAYSGTEVTMNGEDGYLILSPDDVLCIVEA